MARIPAMALVTLAAFASALSAQRIPGTYHPTSAQCRRGEKALTDRKSESWEWQLLSRCGSAGGRVMAKALRDGRLETDLMYLERLYDAMGGAWIPTIFEAALTVMQDRGASPEARSTAVLIAVAPVDNALALPLNLSPSEALRSGQCRLLPISDAGPRAAVAPGAVARLGKVLYDLSGDPHTPPLLQAFVACVRPVMRDAIADAVPTSLLRLSHLCENNFRVENGSSEGVQVSVQGIGTEDRSDLWVPPKGARTITMEKPGTAALYYRGKLIQTAENRRRECLNHFGGSPPR
jgi:hypothetical protein